ncbi:MAG: hypothetical protein MI746_01865 [Pseudomonadales bacterium]|nr:hypothetical protein [Pseudomonadales bacterium]
MSKLSAISSDLVTRKMVQTFGLLKAALCTSALGVAYAQQPDTDADGESVWLNAYDQIRSEQLIDEGQRAMSEGEYGVAESIFLDAVQIAKVNFGLNAEEQRMPLELAISAQLAQGKWEQVDNHFSYFEWLNDEIYTRDFYAYLRGTEQLSSMLLKASADTSNPLAVRYLIAAKNLNWRAVSSIEATLGESHTELAPWLYNIVLTHYYQSSLIKRHGVSSTVFRNEQNEEVSGFTLNKGESLRISYRIGRELLERIASIYEGAPQLPPERNAMAQIYLADWELLFGHEDEAVTLYQNAFNELLAIGISLEQANQVFARPTVLPSRSLHNSVATMLSEQREGPVRFNAWSPNYPAAELPSERLAINTRTGADIMALLRFDLHPLLPTGMLNNERTIRLGFNLNDLEVVSTTPDNDLIRERAIYAVSLLQFRPRLENGAPVSFEDVELEYLFPPQFSGFSLTGN